MMLADGTASKLYCLNSYLDELGRTLAGGLEQLPHYCEYQRLLTI